MRRPRRPKSQPRQKIEPPRFYRRLVSLSQAAIAAHCESCADRCSNTIRTARSLTSGEYRFVVLITPSSQEMESPEIPGRFTWKLTWKTSSCDRTPTPGPWNCSEPLGHSQTNDRVLGDDDIEGGFDSGCGGAVDHGLTGGRNNETDHTGEARTGRKFLHLAHLAVRPFNQLLGQLRPGELRLLSRCLIQPAAASSTGSAFCIRTSSSQLR